MGCRSGQRKVIGSAGALFAYYQEESGSSADKIANYHGVKRDGIVFDKVGGKAAAFLPGLDLNVGLTKSQHANLHVGKWDGVEIVKPGYRRVWEVDGKGRPILREEASTGRRSRVPVMEMTVDALGVPEVDSTTKLPLLRQKMEQVHVAGYDITFALDKSVAEFLVAHPEYTDTVRECFLEAVDTAMTVAVEDHAAVVAKTVKTPTEVGPRTNKTQGSATRLEKAEGLIWFVVFGNSSRPTEASVSRGYEVDPHCHAHVFLSSAAYVGNGKWQKVDGKALFSSAEFRASVASAHFDRLMEDRGIKIAYADPDRKGRISSEIAGSNAEARDFFSTNTQRAHDLARNFEATYDRPPTGTEMSELMQATKREKTAAAKDADRLGNIEQVERWRLALDAADIRLTIPKPGQPVRRAPLDDRLETLYARLEAPTGIVLGAASASVFGPEVVLPAVYRAAEGLGFNADQLSLIADHYRDTRLVIARDAIDPSARLYTTHTLVATENFVSAVLDRKASQQGTGASGTAVEHHLGRQTKQLDADQERLVRAIVSTNRLIHGVGKAGSGKTSALKPAVEILRAEELVDDVVVAAVARKRATETGEAVGATISGSIESLAARRKRGWTPTDRTLVILDEAALANTFDMAKLLDIIGPAKLVTIGDDRQASAIGVSGLYSEELAKRPPIELRTVYRQKSQDDVRAYEQVREGRAHEALADLAGRGHVFAADNPSELISLARERYEFHRKSYAAEDVVIVHQGSNHALDAYNRMVQRYRRSHNEISGLGYEVTESDTGRSWTVHKGDRVIVNQSIYDGLDKPLVNGTTGRILHVGQDGSCRLQIDGPEARLVTINLTANRAVQPIGLAYCVSVMKMQGGEVKVGLVVPGSPGTASLNSGYSQLTRFIDRADILVDRETWGEDPVTALADAWSETSATQTATSYMAAWDAEEPETLNLDAYDFDERLGDERQHKLDQTTQDPYNFGDGYGLGL